MTGLSVRIEEMESILLFLYWEETVDEGYLAVERIRDETELTGDEIQEGLKTLGHSGLVDYVYHNKDIGIEEAKITSKGREKARQLLNEGRESSF